MTPHSARGAGVDTTQEHCTAWHNKREESRRARARAYPRLAPPERERERERLSRPQLAKPFPHKESARARPEGAGTASPCAARRSRDVNPHILSNPTGPSCRKYAAAAPPTPNPYHARCLAPGWYLMQGRGRAGPGAHKLAMERLVVGVGLVLDIQNLPLARGVGLGHRVDGLVEGHVCPPQDTTDTDAGTDKHRVRH